MRSTVLPGDTLGILGGGIVGRDIALAARALGYRVRVLDADQSCLVEPLAERAIRAPLHNRRAAVEALRECDVITPSVEHVPSRTLSAIEAAGARLRPAGALVTIAQDRIDERSWLGRHGVPVVPWRAVDSLEQALASLLLLGGRGILKPARRAHDGTTARRVHSAGELVTAWRELGGGRFALEQEAQLDTELAVVVARNSSGMMAAYPPAESGREMCDGVPRLRWSVLPSTLPNALVEKARRLALMIAEQLRLEGLVSVEMFLLADGRLVVNELVPCPHPTLAAAGQACGTGQYEQLVRAVCNLPLGDTRVVRPVAIAPLYGDEWSGGEPRRVVHALRQPGLTMHLYGVRDPLPTQRVGHLAAGGDSPSDAVARVLAARSTLLATQCRGRSRAAPPPVLSEHPDTPRSPHTGRGAREMSPAPR
jgi:5-(carboxyamino)imidazole ribonucleotide synthase